MIHRHFIILI